ASGTVFELMRQAALLCPEILPAPAPSFTIRRSGLTSCTYGARFFVADTPVMGGAKSNLLRQIRRQFHHAGVSRPAPLSTAELLGSVVLFEALSAAELESLASDVAPRSIEPGDVVFHQGDPANSLFVIEAGILEISRSLPEGGTDTIGRIGPGEYIGELGLITKSPRAFTLTSLTHGRALEVSGACLQKLLDSNKTLHAAMERSVRRGMELLDRDDAARAVHPAEQTADLFDRIRAFFHV
ncbi:MAG: cyclic nucleotide-binding domain-containing protein, partial [Caulobacteraceae bacterium]|nr:cyclic nucleotide-binding domain-containing protein [Caulobacteraceae bacterium]